MFHVHVICTSVGTRYASVKLCLHYKFSRCSFFPPKKCNSMVLWITPWSSSFCGITDRKCGKTSSESTVRSGFAAAIVVYTDMGWRLCPTLRDSRLGHCTAMLTISSPTVSVFLAGVYICFILIINPFTERSVGKKNATFLIYFQGHAEYSIVWPWCQGRIMKVLRFPHKLKKKYQIWSV